MSAHSTVPIVGVGASAGGVDALQTLIPAIAPDSGLAFVVVQHLDPDRESVLSKLLARVSAIPVAEIRDETAIEANHIYVIPPNATLTIAQDRLRVVPPTEQRGHRTPIDGFFASLAEARGESAACVILSGTGSDGTHGLRAIKEHGGLSIAQEGAEYDGMMRSAVATGLVDFILPADEIPGRLTEYFRHVLSMDGRKGPDGVRPEAADYLNQIAALLRTRTGHDFSGYKDKTVARRVQRRMQVLQIKEMGDFIGRLRKDPEQLDALLGDLLIGVTNFFRDPAAYKALETEVIPRLFEGKGMNDAVRVWVAGCSTGEEAYSLAMLLCEHAAKIEAAPKLLVFASDIDERALQFARVARYPATVAKDVPQYLLERYFVREDGSFRINSEVRETCLFSAHNLLRDAPFSKLDLISCRNLLIYLTPELQNRLVPLFHYALRDSGYLFLGSSENVTRHPRLFATVDKAHRIFQRRTQLERRLPEFPLTTHAAVRHPSPPAPRMQAEQDGVREMAEVELLARYAPAYVVINGDGELIHASARTGKYLELPAGAPKTDIFSMARKGLRSELRAAVHKAASSGRASVHGHVVLGTNGGRQTIDLIVHPLPAERMRDPLYMVLFQDVGGIQQDAGIDLTDHSRDGDGATVHHLEMELQSTRDRLQTTTEELESSNEELKSGNEELSSMNEELQSANEELETSKEELQSINEELQTVNSELNARVEELSRANSDVANLLESTQIATVFLDRNLAVKSFTPAAKDLFRLVESDAGRPLTHVRARFDSDTVQDDAERVLRTLATIERSVVSTHSDTRFIMRLMPYRTIDNVIAGVVITFVNVTEIAAAEARINALSHDLRNRVQALEALLDLLPVGILLMEDGGTAEVRVNRYGARLIGEDSAGDAPRPVLANFRMVDGGRELKPAEQPLQRAARSGEAVPEFEGRLIRRNGSSVDVMVLAASLLDEDGKPRGSIAAILDISERKRAEEHQQILLHELQHRVKNIITSIGALATRMLKSGGSLDDFSAAFLGRLRAMATTHELLSQTHWTGAELRTLAEEALRPYLTGDGNNVALEGPQVLLAPNTATTLGMVFYELATNAAKYGALAHGNGHVEVRWGVNGADRDEPQVELSWSESGRPLDGTTLGKGFGTGFITRSIEYELHGSVALDLEATGLRCLINFPLGRNSPLADTTTGRGGEDAGGER